MTLQNKFRRIFYVARRHLLVVGIIIGVLGCAALVGFVYFSLPPSDFPENRIVQIDKDMYVSQAAERLEDQHIIRSAFFYKVFVVLLGGSKKIYAGSYIFKEPQNVLRVASRTVNGDFGLTKIGVVVYEGMTVAQIGKSIKSVIPQFDSVTFVKKATPLEGMLFPDTYYFYMNTTPDDVIDMLHGEYEEKIKSISWELAGARHTFKDVLIMASIVEREATSSIDKKIVAGILWKRIDDGMPLQVDAPFYYALGKGSFDLTMKDLTTDASYNTYTRKGLPPTPISNPGMDSIMAAIRPTETKYWFYLSDSKGNMHYAETYDQHLANKRKHID